MTTTTEHVITRATTAVAAAGAASPKWLPMLQNVSEVAALVLPIASLLWIALQIARFVARWSVKSGESGSMRLGRGFIAAAAVVALAMPSIALREGRSLEAYRDIAGIWTICDGVTAGVTAGLRATAAECDAMLAQEVRRHAEGLSACVADPIEAQIPALMAAALVSWTYNIGVSAACQSTLVRRLNAGQWAAVCPELSRWNRADGRVVRGLSNRRAAERADCEAGLRQAGLI